MKPAGHVAIIGVRGRMGAWLEAALTGAGRDVRGADQPLDDATLRAVCAGAAIVVLCVPAGVMEEVAARVAPHLDAGAVLADVASVKLLPLRAMARHYVGPVVGTHPLFGPTPGPDENRVCITPPLAPREGAEEALCLVEEMFAGIGCVTFRDSAEAHDRALAAIQGLNFTTSVAYFAMLSQHPECERFLTPSFMRRLEASRRLLTSDAELFTGLVEHNPLSQDVIREYRAYLNVAAGGDLGLLAQLAAKWF